VVRLPLWLEYSAKGAVSLCCVGLPFVVGGKAAGGDSAGRAAARRSFDLLCHTVENERYVETN